MTDKRRRGKPRLFDEDELIARIRDRARDLVALRLALEANGESPAAAAACARFLESKSDGDPTGGVAPKSAYRYRRMLYDLPSIPLPPSPRRRRAASEHGSSDLGLVAVGAMAGAVAIAAQSPSVALCATALLAAPIMPEASPEDAEQLLRAA